MKKSILFLLLILLTSCGARKTQKSKIEEEVKIETQSTVVDKTVTDTNTNIQTVSIDTSNTNEIVIEPIDNTKEFVVNNVVYKNARITNKKVKSGVSVVKNEKVAQTVKNDIKNDSKEQIELNKSTFNKEADRKQFDWTKIIIVSSLLFLGIVMFILYYYFGIGKKKKDNPDTT